MTDLTGTVTQLQERRRDFVSKLERANKELAARQVEVETIARSISLIDHELDRRLRPSPEPRLSDHALVRFIERVLNVDVEALRARIMTPAVVDAVKAGASGVTVEGVKFVVNDNVIVTTLGEGQNLKKKTKKHTREIPDDDFKRGLKEYYEEQQ